MLHLATTLHCLAARFAPDDYADGEAPVTETPPRSAFAGTDTLAALARLHGGAVYAMESVREVRG